MTDNTWTKAVRVALGSAGSHRATGGRTAASRAAMGEPTRLGSHITEEVAWDGLADMLVKQPRSTFRYEPTTRIRQRMTASATYRQHECEYVRGGVGLALTGNRNGHRSKHVPDDGLEQLAVDPLAEEEARLDVVAIVESLPGVSRSTVERLLQGKGCPDDMKPSVWYKRVERAREAFRQAWRDR